MVAVQFIDFGNREHMEKSYMADHLTPIIPINGE